MKKLLGLLAAVGLTAASTASVVACSDTVGGINNRDKNALGEIANIFPETILAAYKAKNDNVNTDEMEVFSYDQTSAKLIYKKGFSNPNKFEPINVTYTIKALDLSENNKSLVTNIIAGNMDENGIIDQTLPLKDVMSQGKVTKNSIRTSFAQMNGIYLNESDIEIGEVNYEDNSVSIKSKNQNILKGDDEEIITLNKNINSADLLRITDVGKIYLPGSLWKDRADYFGNENTTFMQLMVSVPFVFQSVGDRNKLFTYLVQDLMVASISMMGEMEKDVSANISVNSLKLNLSWGEQNPLAVENIIDRRSLTTTIEYKLIEENRIVFGDYIPANDLKVSSEAYNGRSISKIIEEIYTQMNDEFKNLVSQEMFGKFVKVHFVENDEIPTIEILPGGDYLYAIDSNAWELIESLNIITDPELIEKLTPPKEGTNPGYKFVVADE
ncbi:hypothetical protein SCLARK_00652 [Spiroplasma clarkii]|uniref:Lipoprotein n=1 Tax=Spiroplasma clarkii TaxID=2139 RepID=A0A1Y0L0P4_9MOLU|nr:lipoprotein [Spiroplasma clarkii]ARU91315.1 hypothetical protein SCLARK_00652 [Spiroplasma clarkii]ATX70740.1 hypothetical protein SCLAR_v1c04160 [Spiroplasma clarkii]